MCVRYLQQISLTKESRAGTIQSAALRQLRRQGDDLFGFRDFPLDRLASFGARLASLFPNGERNIQEIQAELDTGPGSIRMLNVLQRQLLRLRRESGLRMGLLRRREREGTAIEEVD